MHKLSLSHTYLHQAKNKLIQSTSHETTSLFFSNYKSVKYFKREQHTPLHILLIKTNQSHSECHIISTFLKCQLSRPPGFDQGYRLFSPRIWRFFVQEGCCFDTPPVVCMFLLARWKCNLWVRVSYASSGQADWWIEEFLWVIRFSRNITECEHSVILAVMLLHGKPIGGLRSSHEICLSE